MKKLITSAFLLFVLFSYADAKEYSVSSADGFNKIIGQVVAGDMVTIANGNYSAWALNIPTKGTKDKPVIIRAQTTGKVVFSGDVSQPVFSLTGEYTQVVGFTFTGCNVLKDDGANGLLIGLKGTNNCRVTQCTFTQNVAKAQFMPIVMIAGNGANNQVDHCSFISNIDNQEVQVKITADAVPLYTLINDNVFKDKEKVSWKVFNGGECVQIGQDPVMLGTAVSKTTVRNNTFIRCNGEAEVISNKASGNSYIHNYFEDCQGELVLRGGHDCLIDSNTIKGGSGGIRVNGTHHTITNNAISGVKTGIRLMYGMAKGKTEIGFYIAASDCIIKNNEITNAATGILIGDSKNVDWTGKFDTKKYPSRVTQDVAPFNNAISNNTFKQTQQNVVEN